MQHPQVGPERVPPLARQPRCRAGTATGRRGRAPRRGRRCRCPHSTDWSMSSSPTAAPAAGQPRPGALRVGVAAQRVRPQPGEHGVPLVRREHLAGRRPAQVQPGLAVVIRSRSAPRGRGGSPLPLSQSPYRPRWTCSSSVAGEGVEQVLAVRVDALDHPPGEQLRSGREAALRAGQRHLAGRRAAGCGHGRAGGWCAPQARAVPHGAYVDPRLRQRGQHLGGLVLRQHRDPPGVPLVAAVRRREERLDERQRRSPRRASGRRR